ncbi:MAG: homoprotocatechuate degradation operon regulator HpaR [Deinococcales bacterium]
MALLRGREAVMVNFRAILLDDALTEQQWRIMQVLYDQGDKEISELSRICYILLPSMSGILKRMATKDLVHRSQDSQDQRRVTISLSAKGQDLVKKIAPRLEEQYRRIEKRFGKEQLEHLYRLLADLEHI